MLRAGMQPRPDAMPAVGFTEPGPALAVLTDRLRERASSLRTTTQRSAVQAHRVSDLYLDVQVRVLSESSL
jgi:hypothetical protein